MQFTKSLHPGRPICLPAWPGPGTPASLPYPCRPVRANSSIAAPATATAFLLVSLSKIPRGSNGAERFPATTRPEAFPIKANDFSSKWKVPLEISERPSLICTLAYDFAQLVLCFCVIQLRLQELRLGLRFLCNRRFGLRAKICALFQPLRRHSSGFLTSCEQLL
jgi:hypothetical protein